MFLWMMLSVTGSTARGIVNSSVTTGIFRLNHAPDKSDGPTGEIAIELPSPEMGTGLIYLCRFYCAGLTAALVLSALCHAVGHYVWGRYLAASSPFSSAGK